jgi:hypothetical protein
MRTGLPPQLCLLISWRCILTDLWYRCQVPSRCVFFADILGFGEASLEPTAVGARDSLSLFADLLSMTDTVSRILNWEGWVERYGLSDSLFLVAEDAGAGAAAAAELFFNLAYVSHAGEMPVLLRGGVAWGEVLTVGPLIKESGAANLVGAAVVHAVRLERSAAKGPRLFVDEATAQEIGRADSGRGWLLDGRSRKHELLWLLPPSPDDTSGSLIGEMCGWALDLIERFGEDAEVREHYLGYLDLVIRSLCRLEEYRPGDAAEAIGLCGLRERRPRLEQLLMAPEQQLIQRIKGLVVRSGI